MAVSRKTVVRLKHWAEEGMGHLSILREMVDDSLVAGSGYDPAPVGRTGLARDPRLSQGSVQRLGCLGELLGDIGRDAQKGELRGTGDTLVLARSLLDAFQRHRTEEDTDRVKRLLLERTPAEWEELDKALAMRPVPRTWAENQQEGYRTLGIPNNWRQEVRHRRGDAVA